MGIHIWAWLSIIVTTLWWRELRIGSAQNQTSTVWMIHMERDTEDILTTRRPKDQSWIIHKVTHHQLHSWTITAKALTMDPLFPTTSLLQGNSEVSPCSSQQSTKTSIQEEAKRRFPTDWVKKTHLCGQCDKSFSRIDSLKRRHTGTFTLGKNLSTVNSVERVLVSQVNWKVTSVPTQGKNLSTVNSVERVSVSRVLW